MAVDAVSAVVFKHAYPTFDGVIVDGLRSLGNLTTEGSVAEIDKTDGASSAREFVPGLADPGTSTIDMVIDPTSDIYDKFVESQKGKVFEFRVVFGEKGANSRYTDGKGWVTATFPAGTSSPPTGITAGAGKITIAKAQAGILNATRKNHYIRTGNPSSPVHTKITAVNILANGDVELAHAGNALTIGNFPVQIIFPAFEYRRSCYVQDKGIEAGIDQVLTAPVQFRNSGTGTKVVGTPDITI